MEFMSILLVICVCFSSVCSLKCDTVTENSQLFTDHFKVSIKTVAHVGPNIEMKSYLVAI